MDYGETIIDGCRDIAYEAADKELEAGEVDFTINIEELTKACNTSSSIAAKGGPQDHKDAAKAKRRAGAGCSQDVDASAAVPGGKLQGRPRPGSIDLKQPAPPPSSAKSPSGKLGLPRKNSKS
jgi:hypothetical protein